ncbi:MAG: hypothetical protein ACP5RE_03575 [Candidatus Acidifodinimicrobium sp.]
MKWSFEVPFNYLQLFDKHQDYLFVLSQYLDDRRYYDYIKNSNKLKILDNGANESEFVSMKHLIERARELNADVIVIPDKQFDYLITRRMLMNSLQVIDDLKAYEFQYMGVVQGTSEEEIMKCENEMIESGRVDYIGLPFKIVMEYGVDIVDKVVNNSPVSVHFLGLGSLQQVRMFKTHPNVISMDTSLPVNFATLGLGIEENQRPKPGLIKIPDINHLDDKQLKLLELNILKLKGV